MKIPKELKDYCKKCNLHTLHKLKVFKAAAGRALAWGNRQHERVNKHGYGGKAEFTAKVKKQTKKPVFVAECIQCGKKHYFVIPKRMKKAELEAAS